MTFPVLVCRLTAPRFLLVVRVLAILLRVYQPDGNLQEQPGMEKYKMPLGVVTKRGKTLKLVVIITTPSHCQE